MKLHKGSVPVLGRYPKKVEALSRRVIYWIEAAAMAIGQKIVSTWVRIENDLSVASIMRCELKQI